MFERQGTARMHMPAPLGTDGLPSPARDLGAPSHEDWAQAAFADHRHPAGGVSCHQPRQLAAKAYLGWVTAVQDGLAQDHFTANAGQEGIRIQLQSATLQTVDEALPLTDELQQTVVAGVSDQEMGWG